MSFQVKRDVTARMDDIQEANLRTMADLDARVVSLARTLQAHVDECDRRLNMVRQTLCLVSHKTAILQFN